MIKTRIKSVFHKIKIKLNFLKAVLRAGFSYPDLTVLDNGLKLLKLK